MIGNNGDVFTNGHIRLINNVGINGDAHPGPEDNGGDFLDLPPGIYYFSEMNLRDNLIICVSGQIYIYVDGDVDMAEGGIVNQTLKPVNLQIYPIEDRYWLPDNIDLYAVIYSTTSTIEKGGGSGGCFGKMVGQKIKINGSEGLHGDESIVFGNLVFALDCRHVYLSAGFLQVANSAD